MPFPTSTKQRTRLGRKKGLRSGDTAARKRHRARLAEARAERPPTWRELDKRLHSLDAQFVKMRDGHVCQRALRYAA